MWRAMVTVTVQSAVYITGTIAAPHLYLPTIILRSVFADILRIRTHIDNILLYQDKDICCKLVEVEGHNIFGGLSANIRNSVPPIYPKTTCCL